MAGTKISEATLRETLTGTENIPIVDTDLTKGRTTLAKVKEFVQPDLGDYVTETELEGKGYATTVQLASKLDKTEYESEKVNFATKTELGSVEDRVETLEGLDLTNLVAYGIERDKTVSSYDCTRIGNMAYHKTLPVHSKMKGCLLSDDGAVLKYLDADDWTGETRDGSQGQVMVEVPEHYMRFDTEGNKQRVYVSEVPFPGAKKIKKYYVAAYEASLQRSTNKLCSVVNTDADYRGGNNTSGWDGTYRSLLGRPATNISSTNFREYARNRKSGSTEWNKIPYSLWKDLYWLFVIEYATLNSQKAYNSAKDSNGYAQGGLGEGVTTLDWTKWTNFNGNNPFIPCGYTDSLGNGTGEVEYSMPTEYDSTIKKVKVNRYHGIENIFGHIWKWVDGINVRISPNSPTGDGLSKIYVTDNPEHFNDSGYDNMTYIGDEARTGAYVKEIIFGEGGEIMPSVVGGSSSTYFCDYHYTNIPTSETLRGVLFGGTANDGSDAGLVFAPSGTVPSDTSTDFGSRLCFIPA